MPSIIKVDQIQSDTGNVAFTGNIAFPAGSATLPSITAVGDTNTGIFFPAADTIAFAEGGVEGMRISNTANVGIGTTNPTAKLNIVDGFVSYESSDANGYPRFTTSSGSAQVGLFRSGSGSTGGGYIGADGDNCLDARDVTFITRLRVTQAGLFQMNSGYGSVATAFGCRAWVHFNGTGTVAIRGSGNVSSITDNGTGAYRVNFTTSMPDTNYMTTAIGSEGAGAGDKFYGYAVSTSQAQFTVYSAGGSLVDNPNCQMAVFR